MCPLGGTKSRPIASSFYKFYIVMSHWWYSLIAVVGGSGFCGLETCPEMQGIIAGGQIFEFSFSEVTLSFLPSKILSRVI